MGIEDVLSLSELKERLVTTDKDSRFIWLPKPGSDRATMAWNGRYAGTIAGGPWSPNPLCPQSKMWKISIKIGEKKYHVMEHRLKFFYHNGRWPENEIDHIDGNSLNNALSNLREATRSENMMNTGIYKRNKSGVKGVSYDIARGKWKAQLQLKEKGIQLSKRFETMEEARDCYDSWVETYFGEFGNAEGVHEPDAVV